MPISLAIRGPDGKERRAEFDRTKITVGAHPRCELVIEEEGVDERQLVLIEREGRIELFDIGSGKGALVNGKPTGHAVLQPGDEVWVGGTVFGLASGDDGVSFTESGATVREEMPAPVSAAPAPAEDERFGLLAQVRRLINSIGTNEDVFESILDTLFDAVPVRRGFIALTEDGGDLKVRAHRSAERGQAAGEKIEVSRTLVGKVLSTGKAILTSDAETDVDLSAAMSIHRLRIRAAICVPLTAGDKVIGLLYGDNRERPGSLVRKHLEILNALASVAAVAVEKIELLRAADQKRKIEQSLAIARSIQRNFLPTRAPEVEGLEVWGRSDSCDETGGDYFDYLQTEAGGPLRVVIADVTGHGVGPALLMASVRASLRVLLASETDLERCVHRLNNHLRDDVREGRFVTMFLGEFDPRTGKFRHVGAGHTPPVWYRASDESTQLVYSAGPPLGILPDMRFPEGQTVSLGHGDVLLFTTDGLIEAGEESGEQFGMDRLRALVAAHAHESPQELGEAIFAAVSDHVKGRPLKDDATLVTVKVG